MSKTRIVGTVQGIEAEYEVVQFDFETVMLAVDGDEIVTFCSANSGGFIDDADLLSQAADVVIQIEEDMPVLDDGDDW